MCALFHGYKKLKSGNLTLLYKEGQIRQVCLGRIQILNAVYAAVRDQNWATVPFKVREELIEEAEDGFSITLTLEYSLDKILYTAVMSIEAKNNRLRVSYEGEAGSTFLKNRIGLCVLHPIKECRGKTVLISHPDGSQSESHFPELISPHQPFFNISGMQWRPADKIDASLHFEGEIFEAEDQRNWTDASFKTYCTPLDLPFPVQVKKGELVHQRVSLEVKNKQKSFQASSLSEKRLLSLHPDISSPLPSLGIGQTTETEPLSEGEYEMLRTLPFQHYRVDLHLSKEGWKKVYLAAVSEQKQLGWPLEVALHFGRDPGKELEAFLKQYGLQPAKIRQVLVFDQDFLSNTDLLKEVVPCIRKVISHAVVGGGTDANFAELNRNAPDPEHLDFLCYSICPQLHAFDNLSLVENLEAQTDSIQSALELKDKPVSIAYISLKQRFNAVATDDRESDSAIPESDPRQHTSFVAGWTLASIRNLARSCAASLTYFETAGPRGILYRLDPAKQLSPLFHLFEEILSGDPIEVVHTTSSHPLEFDALALKGPEGNKVLIANYTENEIDVEIKGLTEVKSRIFQLEAQGWVVQETPELQKNILSLKPTAIYKICYTL